MQEIHITSGEEGQQLYKILQKFLNEAPSSFIYKMLRKKNIKLNGKKAEGREKLKDGDVIAVFLADDTIAKFRKAEDAVPSAKDPGHPEILFETEDIILMNKPAGILSQKAGKDDISINEQMIAYCLDQGKITKEEFRIRKPSVCNRLDRNTTGLIAAGVTIRGLTFLSEMFRERSLSKYYYTIVKGEMTKKQKLKGYLSKDEMKNQVTVSRTKRKEDDSYIETEYEPVLCKNGYTYLKVKLITGKPHQIRAHLAFTGYPILGDGKYGDPEENRYWRKKAGLKFQLLHSAVLSFPEGIAGWEEVSGKTFKAPFPDQFVKIRDQIFGTQVD